MLNNKIDWIEYLRSNVNYRIVSPTIKGLFEGLEHYFGRGIARLVIYFKGETCYWYYDQKDLFDVGKTIIDKLSSSKDFENNFFEILDEKTGLLLDFVDHHKVEDLHELSKNDLTQIYKEYHKLMTEWYSASLLIDPTDEYLMVTITEKIRSIIKAKLGDKYSESEFSRVYEILTSPNKLSYLNDERKMLLKLAREVKIGAVDINGKDFVQEANKIVAKFWWTGLGWKREEARVLDDIKKSIEEIIEKTDITAELDKMSKYANRTHEGKIGVNGKYNFSDDRNLSIWLSMFDRLVEYHDSRKEVQMKTNYWEYRFLDEVYKDYSVEKHLLDWCSLDEIAHFLETGLIDLEKIKSRSERFLFSRDGDKILVLGGDEAEQEYNKVISSDFSEVRDIQGTSASRGYAVGEAFVAITASEAMNIKEGQVLVTGMTTPDFVPAMKKAVAIVTDEGGITCHAAIVSRELGLPCIVGTRLGTKIIKSGDVVEVKANHGTVIIKE